MDITCKLGSEIKRKRKDFRLTQERLADIANLDVHTVSDLENNNSNPKLSTVLTVTSILDIDLNQFQDKNKRRLLNGRRDTD